MTISGVTTDTPLVQPDNAVGKRDLGRTDFMTLYITQLQHQDPMKPMDSYEMASQMAEFSNMDATLKMSDNMEKLLEFQTSQNNLQILTLLNSDVQIAGNMIAVVEGETNPTEFVLTDAAETIEVEIYDMAGRKVWKTNFGSHAAGSLALDWDGTNSNGDQVIDGPYKYEVNAEGVTGEPIEVEYRSTGKVTGVNFAGRSAMVTIDDFVEAAVADVIKVK